jgi:hypothetical protein
MTRAPTPAPRKRRLPEDVGERCAYCDVLILHVRHRIHRDGLTGDLDTPEDLFTVKGLGPEVALCDEHGSGETPTCEEIWQRIAERREARA